jgi:hypothetical protein
MVAGVGSSPLDSITVITECCRRFFTALGAVEPSPVANYKGCGTMIAVYPDVILAAVATFVFSLVIDFRTFVTAVWTLEDHIGRVCGLVIIIVLVLGRTACTQHRKEYQGSD